MMPPPDVGTEHRDRQRDGQPENISLCGGIKVVSGTTNFATLYYVQLLYVFILYIYGYACSTTNSRQQVDVHGSE